jgi:tRNA-dihydrouridine synthase 1
MSKSVSIWLTGAFKQIHRKLSPTRIMAQTVAAGAEPPSVTKLTGRAFYESIGSPKMIVAPMVDRSEFVRRSSSPLPHSDHSLTRCPGLETAHTILPE